MPLPELEPRLWPAASTIRARRSRASRRRRRSARMSSERTWLSRALLPSGSPAMPQLSSVRARMRLPGRRRSAPLRAGPRRTGLDLARVLDAVADASIKALAQRPLLVDVVLDLCVLRPAWSASIAARVGCEDQARRPAAPQSLPPKSIEFMPRSNEPPVEVVFICRTLSSLAALRAENATSARE